MIEIYEVTANKRDYMDLLFLADEQEDMIEKYLDRGSMYVLEDGGVKDMVYLRKELHSFIGK